MALRIPSVSSISSVSSIERRHLESEGSLHTLAATVSASDAERPRLDQRSLVGQINEVATTEPLLQRKPFSQHEEQTAGSEVKAPAGIQDLQYDRSSWYHDWWFWEIAGALLSLGSTVAIIVLLAMYDRQPVPVLRYGITLNAMLSVLSTIAKVSPKVAAVNTFRSDVRLFTLILGRLRCCW